VFFFSRRAWHLQTSCPFDSRREWRTASWCCGSKPDGFWPTASHYRWNGEGRVTSHISFRFRDGSLYASFKTPLESWIDATTGEVKVQYSDKGQQKEIVFIADHEAKFRPGRELHTAEQYRMRTDIGGVAGLVAPVVGNKPPDTEFWLVGGEAPSFVASEGPLYQDGPIWRIELVSPVWPRAAYEAPQKKK
jgi:hypothetical protein